MSKSNKISESASNETEHRLALLGLALNTPAPTGKRPSLDEIELYRLHKLPGKRADEVKAYIARDSECYQAWSDLVDSEQEIKTHFSHSQVKTGVHAWLKRISREPAAWIGGGFAAAAVSLFIGVIAVKTVLMPGILAGIDKDYAGFDSSPDIKAWIQTQNSEKSIHSIKPNAYEHYKQAILVGIHQGLTELNEMGKLGNEASWKTLIESYPQRSPACTQAQELKQCEDRNLFMVNMGRWLTLLQLNCTSTDKAVVKEYLQLQQERLEFFLQQARQFPELSPLQKQLKGWTSPSSEQALCRDVATLLASLDS